MLKDIKFKFSGVVAEMREEARRSPSRELSIALTNAETAMLWLQSVPNDPVLSDREREINERRNAKVSG